MFRAAAGIKHTVTILVLVAIALTDAPRMLLPLDIACCLSSSGRAFGQAVQPIPAARMSDSARVEKAIELAVDHLLSSQLPDGGWPDTNSDPYGTSCLVTLALLNAGMDPNDPPMARALQHIDDRELSRTYGVSLQTMALCAANPNRYAQQIERNTRWLMEAQNSTTGGWTYDIQNRNSTTGDPSNSQFALLALHEAQRTGNVKLPADAWNAAFSKAQKYWLLLQNRDGSFPYNSGAEGRGSMTCAGIASLVIAGSQLDALEAKVGGTIQCCGQQDDREDRLAQALNWLARAFSVQANPGHSNYHLYYLYALERVGRLTGQRFIGDHDWYREGASEIIVLQNPATGRVTGRFSSGGGNAYSETAFALLFLAKGKRQIVVSRLEYGNDTDWNHHSTAIQNLTAHTEQAWKRDLAWQTIRLEKASLADLLESPVLFISGCKAPNFSIRDKQLLKEYVEQNGFLFVEACAGNGCDGREFERYFQNLVVELFDQPLEKLSPDHPVWYAQARVLPSDLPGDAWLYGVQTCCRLGVVYSPVSLSCRWELNRAYGAQLDYPPAVRSELDTVTKIGLNVLAYATGKQLKEKLDTVTILEDRLPLTTSDRGVLSLPVLRHGAGADDAPRAIPNLQKWFGKELPSGQSSERKLIDISTEQLSEHPIVFMHGRGRLRLSESQREALRTHFENGGFLFADAICADLDFAESFRQEMEIVLGDRLSNISEADSMLTPKYNGYDIRQVQLLDPDRSGDEIVATQRTISPRLEIGRFENRVAVVFSPLDISCALESRHSLQCRGYLREDAARIGINIILFALQQ